MSKTVFKEKIQSFLNDTRNKGNTYAHNGFSSQIMPRSCDHVFCVLLTIVLKLNPMKQY